MDVEEIRSRVGLGEFTVTNPHSTDFPANYPGYADQWDLARFKKGFVVRLVSLSSEELQFDMIGVDAAIANAVRRILLAEVPTMAIEKVYINCNTSIVQDEILAHRLGLIPIAADPRLFKMPPTTEDGSFPEPSPGHALEFKLDVKCSRSSHAPKGTHDPHELYLHSSVTSGDIKWVPIGDQRERLSNIRPVNDDILIAKMRPGHVMDLRLVCVKGIGQDHAKFSPVATACYRLLPEIQLTRPVRGDRAKRLARCFPKGVIRLVEGAGGEVEAEVGDVRRDTCSREVLRHEDLRDCVKLSRVRDHFIFSVESTGALPPEELVGEAIQVLMGKCQQMLSELKDLTHFS